MARSAHAPKGAFPLRASNQNRTERKPPAVLRHVAEDAASSAGAWTGASRLLAQNITMRRLKRFIALEPAVLQGDRPAAIHDIRVASRRLQQSLDLLYPKPRPSKVRKLRRSIRKSRRALSGVRNDDVLLKRAEKNLRRKRLVRREVWDAFHVYLAKRRKKDFIKAAVRIGRLNLPACFAQLKSYIAKHGAAARAGSEPLGSGEAEAPFHETVIRVLGQRWEALRNCLADARREPSAAALHAVRIAVKRLRYLAETMAAMGAPGSQPAVERLRRLQHELGGRHDEEVLCETMLEMVSSPGFLDRHLELAVEAEKLVIQIRQRQARSARQCFSGASDSVGELAAWYSLLAPAPMAPAEEALDASAG